MCGAESLEALLSCSNDLLRARHLRNGTEANTVSFSIALLFAVTFYVFRLTRHLSRISRLLLQS
jgi:hypothetical protein